MPGVFWVWCLLSGSRCGHFTDKGVNPGKDLCEMSIIVADVTILLGRIAKTRLHAITKHMH